MKQRRRRNSADDEGASAPPESITDILGSLTKKGKLREQLDQAQIWHRWPEIAGGKLCGRGHPLRIKDQTLTIQAEDAMWMHRFSYHKYAIISRANRIVGKVLIEDIFIVLAPDDDPVE
ncbi:MAG: DUF721 domain-containing protein [Candidatus Hydrogenedentes bacterium]|nr:DUF721 domain-containing protein [Candidatus Hydrogenedentota bacterium]